MPPTRAALKARGWSDEEIDASFAEDRKMEEQITKMMAEGKTMLEILEAI